MSEPFIMPLPWIKQENLLIRCVIYIMSYIVYLYRKRKHRCFMDHNNVIWYLIYNIYTYNHLFYTTLSTDTNRTSPWESKSNHAVFQIFLFSAETSGRLGHCSGGMWDGKSAYIFIKVYTSIYIYIYIFIYWIQKLNISHCITYYTYLIYTYLLSLTL
jgi:hypothetical protein